MNISAETVKTLRDKTGVSVMQCKKALEEADGDMQKALEILARVSADIVRKKSDRALKAGTVASYVHNTKQVGTMVLLSCETDFVGKNEEFIRLAYDIAMHAAAMRSEEPAELLEQPFIKDGAKTVCNLLEEATQKFGERIELARFERLSVK